MRAFIRQPPALAAIFAFLAATSAIANDETHSAATPDIVTNEPAGATLRVTVTNLKNTKGQLIVAVFASKDTFLKKPVGEAAVPIADDLTGYVEFPDLSPGVYAVVAFHDKNKNGDLDTFLIVPREDYGFSNNARNPFGPPSFKSASIEFGDENLDITFKSK